MPSPSYRRVGPSEIEANAELLSTARRYGVVEDITYLQNMMRQETNTTRTQDQIKVLSA